MDYTSLIFEICILPILGVLTTFIVALIRKKVTQINEQIDNDLARKYLNLLGETIVSCVTATNQTYVETLKKENKFDLEAQKKAFEITKEAILDILSIEAINYLNSLIGDLDTYIDEQIEATVNHSKR